MARNPNKSVAILFGTSQRLKSLTGLKSVNVAGAVIPQEIKIFGATLDATLLLFVHQQNILEYASCSAQKRKINLDQESKQAHAASEAILSSIRDDLLRLSNFTTNSFSICSIFLAILFRDSAVCGNER